MALNIYHVDRPSRPGSYDEYHKFVVICHNKDTAKRTHPDGVSILDPTTRQWVEKDPSKTGGNWRTPRSSQWLEIEELKDLQVTYIGQAAPHEKERVVIFNYVHG
jgi:hypothetical protein